MFRWVMEDVFDALQPDWSVGGCGIEVDDPRLMY